MTAPRAARPFPAAAFLLLGACMCLVDTTEALVKGRARVFQALLAADTLLLTLFLVLFAWGLEALVRGRGGSRLHAALLVLPLPLVVLYHLSLPTWLTRSIYKILVGLHFALGPRMPPPA